MHRASRGGVLDCFAGHPLARECKLEKKNQHSSVCSSCLFLPFFVLHACSETFIAVWVARAFRSLSRDGRGIPLAKL